MKCPCRGCADRTMTCKYAGQCEKWETYKAEEKKKKEWERNQKPIYSEQCKKSMDKNIVVKARGWKRRGGHND